MKFKWKPNPDEMYSYICECPYGYIAKYTDDNSGAGCLSIENGLKLDVMSRQEAENLLDEIFGDSLASALFWAISKTSV